MADISVRGRAQRYSSVVYGPPPTGCSAITPSPCRTTRSRDSRTCTGGPDLSYSFSSGGFGRGGNFPTYAELMTQTDAGGEHLGYLASEDHFTSEFSASARRTMRSYRSSATSPGRRPCALWATTCAGTTRPSRRSTPRMSRCISSSRRMTGNSSTATSPRCLSMKRVR